MADSIDFHKVFTTIIHVKNLEKILVASNDSGPVPEVVGVHGSNQLANVHLRPGYDILGIAAVKYPENNM